MLPIIAVLVFLAVGLTAFEVLRPKADPVRRRLVTDMSTTPVPEPKRRMEGSLSQRVFTPALGRAGHLAARLLPGHWIRAIEHMLIHANEPWSLPGFLGVWTLSIGIAFVVALWVNSAMAESATVLRFTTVGMVLATGAILPYARLRNLVRKRRKAIVRAMPDALDLLTTSVEAGLGVDAAFAIVVDKTTGPLSDTFALYLRQIGLGRGRQEALAYVADRTGVQDLIAIAHNVNQGEELGTPLGDVLRRQAEELRSLRRQRAQEAAQRAPVLMTIPMALCFLPAMIAVVIVPSIMNLMRFVQGLGG